MSTSHSASCRSRGERNTGAMPLQALPPNPARRVVDVARDLLAARPELPIVFLSATRDPELLARARAIAPVLDKLDGLGRIEAWAAALTRDAP